MPKARHGWIGIDLGTQAVKIAQLERAGGRVRLCHATVIERGEAAGSLGQARSAVDWWQEVCRAAAGEGFLGRRAACVLPMEMTHLQALTLPDGPEAERRAMIAHEQPDFGAHRPSRSAFDYWDVRLPGEAGPAGRENVNVLWIDEEQAARVAGSVAWAGWQCNVLDGLPLALARAVRMAAGSDTGGPVAAVDWGFANATLSIVHDGRPLFTRQLRGSGCGGLTAAVGQALGLTRHDAGHLLTLYGVPAAETHDDAASEVRQVIGDAAAEMLNEMVTELDKTLSYLAVHRRNLSPQLLWLFGGGATIRNIAAYLSASIGLPVQRWRLPASPDANEHDPRAPAEMFGAAAALSALAWES